MNTIHKSKRLNVFANPLNAKCFEYSETNLVAAIECFCYHKLKHINPNDLPQIYIEIDTYYSEDKRNYTIYNNNNVIIALSSQLSCNRGYAPSIKRLFHTFLHEFYLFYFLLAEYQKSDKSVDIGIFAERKYEDDNFNEENSNAIFDAELFVHDNMASLLNMYQCDLLCLPDYAFMPDKK